MHKNYFIIHISLIKRLFYSYLGLNISILQMPISSCGQEVCSTTSNSILFIETNTSFNRFQFLFSCITNIDKIVPLFSSHIIYYRYSITIYENCQEPIFLSYTAIFKHLYNKSHDPNFFLGNPFINPFFHI